MHDGSFDPGFTLPMRRIDTLPESAVPARQVPRRSVVVPEADGCPSIARPMSAEQRLLEQAWEDYYSV